MTTRSLAGLISFTDSFPAYQLTEDLQRMKPRGISLRSDSGDVWLDPDSRVGFGYWEHEAVDATSQAAIWETNRSVLVLNGKIYNEGTVRAELEACGEGSCSHSETEVICRALETWGLDAIDRLNGMFAFVWYEKKPRKLLLARDHAGIKPLYYYIHPNGKGMAFASRYNQLLHTHWGEPGPVRLDVLNLFLRLHHIPPPYGLLQNTYQLQPGHAVLIHENGRIEDHCWWQFPRSPHIDLYEEEAVEAAGAAIKSAVASQRVAEAPLGVFLSGGVDSPLITAITREQTSADLKAFTIGNPDWHQDESADAGAYAMHLDVDFRLLNITGADMADLIPRVWEAQSEPFADYSILPSMMVCRFAREEVRAALSGDGGDELFFGYQRPLSLLRNGTDFRFPWLLRYGLYAAGRLGIIPARSEVIAARSPADYYFRVNCRTSEKDLSKLAPDLPGLPRDFSLYKFGRYQGKPDLANYSRVVEFYGQLQRGLKKMEMASSYYGFEVRTPLLDRRVIEASLRIDPFMNMKDNNRKQVLVKLLQRYIPREIIPTSKRGFAVPLGDWFRDSLRPVVEDMLFSADLYPTGLFNKKELRTYWEQHLRKEKDHKWGLWSILALQGWARANL